MRPSVSNHEPAAALQVRLIEGLTEGPGAAWPEAAEAATSRFFHSSAWARVLSETYGFQPLALAASLGETVQGFLPLMEIDSYLTGKRGTSLPFTDECEPLCQDQTSFNTLWSGALAHGRSRGWKSLELRGGQPWLSGIAPSVSFFGHRLDFPAHASDLAAKFDPSVRRAMRKAEQSGLTVEFSRSPAAMNAFYGLLQKTRQRHGLPPQPRAFFAAIQRHVMAADRGWVVLARKGDLLVAGAIFLHSGSTAIYKYGASDDVHQALRGNNLLMGRALEWYAQAGFGGMDFGRTSLGNPGLRRFKLSWGTTERTLAYYHYSFRQSRFVPVVDKASGWHNAVFRRLPKILSQWIGQVLYKHID